MNFYLFQSHTERRAYRYLLRPILVAICSCFVVGSASADVLSDLITASLESYPSIRSKNMLRKSAKAEEIAAGLSFLPKVSVDYETMRRGNPLGKYQSMDPYSYAVISQPIFVGGLWSSFRKSKASLSAADWALRDEAESVAIRVVNAYSSWYGARKRTIAAEKNIQSLIKLNAMMTRRAESGVSPATDQNLGVSRLLQARSELASYQAAENKALTALSQLAGERLDSNKLLESVTPFENYQIPDDVVMRSVDSSPTIKRYEFAAEVAHQNSKVIRNSALPQVQLEAKQQISDTSGFTVGTKRFIGLTVTYDSSNGFSNIPKAVAAYDVYKSSLLDLDAAKRDLIVKVNQDVSDFAFQKSNVQSLRKSLELSKIVSESYQRLFFVGRKSWQDLMNSVREEKDTEAALGDAESQVLATSQRLRIYMNGLDFENGELNLTREALGAKSNPSAAKQASEISKAASTEENNQINPVAKKQTDGLSNDALRANSRKADPVVATNTKQLEKPQNSTLRAEDRTVDPVVVKKVEGMPHTALRAENQKASPVVEKQVINVSPVGNKPPKVANYCDTVSPKLKCTVKNYE